jgi:hypothetical protein
MAKRTILSCMQAVRAPSTKWHHEIINSDSDHRSPYLCAIVRHTDTVITKTAFLFARHCHLLQTCAPRRRNSTTRSSALTPKSESESDHHMLPFFPGWPEWLQLPSWRCQQRRSTPGIRWRTWRQKDRPEMPQSQCCFYKLRTFGGGKSESAKVPTGKIIQFPPSAKLKT